MGECIELLMKSDFELGVQYLGKLAFRYRGKEDIFRHMSVIHGLWYFLFSHGVRKN